MTKIINALKDLAVQLTGKQKSQVTGKTVDEVVAFVATNFKIASAESANGLVLKSPDNSVWDISIANDGTISGTKRTTE